MCGASGAHRPEHSPVHRETRCGATAGGRDLAGKPASPTAPPGGGETTRRERGGEAIGSGVSSRVALLSRLWNWRKEGKNRARAETITVVLSPPDRIVAEFTSAAVSHWCPFESGGPNGPVRFSHMLLFMHSLILLNY